nr:hypothetical protein [Tanacetum cinerariifolium]
MEETYHVTFNEADEVITQTGTEGDEININENISFSMMNSCNDNPINELDPSPTIISPSPDVNHGDAPEDKLSTAMMLLARAITQHYSTPTNNRLRTSSNIRNQAVIQDGRVDIQRKNVGYVGNGNRNAGRTNSNQVTNEGNGMVKKIKEYDQSVQRVTRTESTLRKINVHKCNGKGHYVRECPKSRVCDAKYFREQMLLTVKDKVKVNLDAEENDFMLMNTCGDDQLEELNALMIMIETPLS